MQQVKPLHQIPNIAGYWLEVHDQSGKWHKVEVVQRANGLHYLDLPPGVLWSSLVYWREVK